MSWSYDESWVNGRVGPTFFDLYAKYGRKVGDDPGYAVWPSRVLADIYQSHMAPEESLGKHAHECEAILAGSAPQPIPDPGPAPAPLPFAPFRGAFCIPNALPGIPYGDGKRIWTPAFGCYRGTSWQDAMLAQLVQRRHNWIEIQVSGSPYRGDYPEIPLDPQACRADLIKIRKAGLRSIIAFRDDVGADCRYLEPLAAATQGLVDCVMGIYESNGVFDWDEDQVVHVLQEQHRLWPTAINAFHSTTQDNGGRGFGEAPFWNRVAGFVDVYFMQQSGWNHSVADTADRFSDFAVRLNNGINGWPKLKYGVVEFELTTSQTYRTWSEQQGIDMMTAVVNACSTKPTGWMDGVPSGV